MIVGENALNREQGRRCTAGPLTPYRHLQPAPFRPTQWVGVRADRIAQHFGPAGHSVVRRAGRARLHRACDAALGRLGRSCDDPDHQRCLCPCRADAAGPSADHDRPVLFSVKGRFWRKADIRGLGRTV